ncbi:MAG: hypothetical protein NW223_11130 [Hyphomicrobiaceae bacterium]|nr:hypothetical protein [Hyphomicrobiaceae bacterium]
MALLVAGLLAAYTAWACGAARRRGLAIADTWIWAGLAALFLALACAKLIVASGVLKGSGSLLRALARQNGIYTDRRSLQIAATIAVALIAVALLVYTALYLKDNARRLRVVLDTALLAATAGILGLVVLREMDAWSPVVPWARTAIELIAAAGTAAVAISRLGNLRSPARR